MMCKYLNQFSIPETGWRIESCTACKRPYNPSISELANFCKGGQSNECHVIAGKKMPGTAA